MVKDSSLMFFKNVERKYKKEYKAINLFSLLNYLTGGKLKNFPLVPSQPLEPPRQIHTKESGMLHFQASKKSVFLVCKSPEAKKCFSLCLDFLCVLADKLMEETEELCLQREQKEVS